MKKAGLKVKAPAEVKPPPVEYGSYLFTKQSTAGTELVDQNMAMPPPNAATFNTPDEPKIDTKMKLQSAHLGEYQEMRDRESESEEEEEDARQAIDGDGTSKFPVEKDYIFYHGDKETDEDNWDIKLNHAVTAICINHQGAKIATGGANYNVNFYDFGGMDNRGLAFKEIVAPCQAHQIREIGWNRTSTKILIASGKFMATCLNAGGDHEFETIQGDRYVRDQSQTKGHQGMLNGCQWHPRDENKFITYMLFGKKV